MLRLLDVPLVPDPSGALWWAEERLLAVADLHLEKGSGFAARGRMLPPYDTRATLDRLAEAIARLTPRTVLCLGDSFHDHRAAERMHDADRTRLATLAAAVDWVWIAGNHDPDAPDGLGGRVAAEVRTGPLTFRHEAEPGARGEVSGHLHPAAAVLLPGRRVRERCFATDGIRLILPAFGAYAGGLNVLDPAVRRLLRTPFQVHLIRGGKVHAFPHSRLTPDS
ncbi:MAG TPA: ligase-associated DNA damage response endonuclease PdeM [Azospirillum sp.]|nr:ligase-associated DNA damage response endonuclease PdeM [Azospirillum sp.]